MQNTPTRNPTRKPVSFSLSCSDRDRSSSGGSSGGSSGSSMSGISVSVNSQPHWFSQFSLSCSDRLTVLPREVGSSSVVECSASVCRTLKHAIPLVSQCRFPCHATSGGSSGGVASVSPTRNPTPVEFSLSCSDRDRSSGSSLSGISVQNTPTRNPTGKPVSRGQNLVMQRPRPFFQNDPDRIGRFIWWVVWIIVEWHQCAEHSKLATPLVSQCRFPCHAATEAVLPREVHWWVLVIVEWQRPVSQCRFPCHAATVLPREVHLAGRLDHR